MWSCSSFCAEWLCPSLAPGSSCSSWCCPSRWPTTCSSCPCCTAVGRCSIPSSLPAILSHLKETVKNCLVFWIWRLKSHCFEAWTHGNQKYRAIKDKFTGNTVQGTRPNAAKQDCQMEGRETNLCSWLCWRAACKWWLAPSSSPQTRNNLWASLSPSWFGHLFLEKASLCPVHISLQESGSGKQKQKNQLLDEHNVCRRWMVVGFHLGEHRENLIVFVDYWKDWSVSGKRELLYRWPELTEMVLTRQLLFECI